MNRLQHTATRPGHADEEPQANANTRAQEFSLQDPDGYYVTIRDLSSLELRGHAAPTMIARVRI